MIAIGSHRRRSPRQIEADGVGAAKCLEPAACRERRLSRPLDRDAWTLHDVGRHARHRLPHSQAPGPTRGALSQFPRRKSTGGTSASSTSHDCRSSDHTPDERRWSHEEISRGLPTVKPVAPAPSPRTVVSRAISGSANMGHRVREERCRLGGGPTRNAGDLGRRSCRNCAPAGVTEAVHVLSFAHHR
jgi:hypothetical protein